MSAANWFEIVSAVAFVALLVWVVIDTRKRGELGVLGLLAFAGFSIFWQEFYADWGAYLLWTPDFHMLPWGSTTWTTPDKPAMNLTSYPVFMTAAFLAMLALQKWAGRRWPRVHPLVLSLVTAGPVLIVFNLVMEYVSVETLGLWTYVDTVGPVVHSDAGTMPLLYPNIPFGLFGAVTAFLIGWTNAEGRPRFEALIAKPALPHGLKRDVLRAVAWILTFNVTYWLFLITPTLVLRLTLGEPSTLVP
ncbi:MAG: spirocyclase AveC family protein [Mycobacterium sp.]